MPRTCSAIRPDLDDDCEHTPLTPRGMAAPLPLDAPRADVDPRRPATIRIEANLPARRERAPAPSPEQARAPRAPRAGDRLPALVLSQGLLLNAFVVLLVFGWSSPLPGRHYLLGAFALGGIVLAVLIHFALRHPPRRPANEGDRATAPGSRPAGWFGRMAVRALPAALVSVWIALGIYALALPPTASAFQESRPAAATPPHAASTPARAPRPADHAPVRESGKPQSNKRSWLRW